jgi:hypothetical protein
MMLNPLPKLGIIFKALGLCAEDLFGLLFHGVRIT